MSNYQCVVKIKETGQEVAALAIDDVFGEHQYGYIYVSPNQTKVYKEDEIEVIRKG